MDDERKQKILVPIIGLLVIVGGWQAYKLLFGGDSDDKAVPTQAVSSAQMELKAAAEGQSMPGQPKIVTKIVAKPKVKEMRAPTPSPELMAQLKAAEKTQTEYLKLLNQFQLTELAKKLEESRAGIETAKASIATARLDQAKAEAEMHKVSTTKVTVLDAFDNYQVVYIGRNTGRWIAVVSIPERFITIDPNVRADALHFYDVRIGTHLPDGSEVLHISRNSILMARHGRRRRMILPLTSPKLLIENESPTQISEPEKAKS